MLTCFFFLKRTYQRTKEISGVRRRGGGGGGVHGRLSQPMGMVFIDRYRIYISGIKGRSPSNGKLSDFSFYIDSQKSAHRKFKK